MSSSPFFHPLASFPKVPKSPNTPNATIDKKRFKLFSPRSLRKVKGKDVAKASPVVPIPPEVTPQPRTPLRSFTSPYEIIDQSLPLTPEVDMQFGSGDDGPYTSVIEKSPTPSSTVALIPAPHVLLPSARSWHNIRAEKTEQMPSMTRYRAQTTSKPRPKGLIGEPDAFRMYHTGHNQSAPALVASPIQKEEPFVGNLLPTCLLESDENYIGSESSGWERPEVNLDDYPWYFVETTSDTEWIHGLNPLPIRYVNENYTGSL